ncbi:MAG: hypothetical protein IPH04_14865 [Saprospirales bacterium]|nr:hypothetical protein [Saprospirales bacterium]
MKRLLFLFLLIPAFLFSQPGNVEVVLDSTSYVFINTTWYKDQYVSTVDGGIRYIRTPLLCGDQNNPLPCDTSEITTALSANASNAWTEWAGYKATSQERKAAARAVIKDVSVFFEAVFGPANAFTVYQNGKHAPDLLGRYAVKTPNTPGIDFDLVQMPNGTMELQLVSNPLVTMPASLLSGVALRFTERPHARGAMIVTNFNNLVGDVVSVNGTSLTEGVHFSAVTNVTTTAANLASAINAIANVSATSFGATVLITYDIPGNTGNAITMSYTQGTGNGLTLSGNSLSAGANAGGEVWDVGFEFLNDNSKRVFFDDSRNVRLTKKQ